MLRFIACFLVTCSVHVQRISRFRNLIRLEPFDTSNEVGRADERHRRALLSSGTSIIARIIALITPLITIPLTLSYLGAQQYGVWMTISSIVTSLGFADLGIGNGLVNAISEAHGKDNRQLAKEYVSSGFFLLLGIALTLAAAYAIAYRFLPWRKMFGIPSPQAFGEIPHAVTVFLACFLVCIPLGIVDRVLLAYQEGFRTSLWAPLESLLMLFLVYFVIKQDLGLSGLILAISGSSVLVLIANGVFLFGFSRPWLLPQPALIRKSAAGKILKLGFMYSLMQVATVIGYNSDYIVISQILGAKAVAEYAVPIKMFTIVGSLMLIMLSPIWPAYSEAMARGDWAWVQATLKRSLVAGLCITISSGAVFVVFGGTMIARWTGGRILPSTILLFALAIWGIVGGVSACVGTFLAASSIRFQAISAIAAAAANLLLSIYLTKSIGVSGVVFGSIIAQSVVQIPGLVLTRRILRSASTCA